jgi:hypothetical protein
MGRDLISTNGYSQSNRDRWRMIGQPTTPDRWWQIGPAGAVVPWPAWPVLDLTGAPRYAAVVLHFWCFSFVRKQWSARNSPRGSSTGRGLQSRACIGKVQASTFSDGEGTLQWSAHGKVGPNSCGTEHRTPASGR